MTDTKTDAITPAVPTVPATTTQNVALSMETVQGFEALQRAARLFASSDLVPKTYQGNIANCSIALAVALRIRADPLMVFQNLHIIHGRPGWSSAFLIAAVNNSGRFTPLRFVFTGQKGTESYGCFAVAKDLKSNETLEGTEVTMAMAKMEGWSTKDGSKWRTMPEQMLRYRAASFWSRAYSPEITMGFLTREEVEDELPIGTRTDPVDLNPPHPGSVLPRVGEITQSVPAVTEPPPPPPPSVDSKPPEEKPAAKAEPKEEKEKKTTRRVGDVIRERLAREAAEEAAKAKAQQELPVAPPPREPGEEG